MVQTLFGVLGLASLFALFVLIGELTTTRWDGSHDWTLIRIAAAVFALPWGILLLLWAISV